MTTSWKRIGVLGSGQVGQVLAKGFLGLGCEVKVGTRDPGKLATWLKEAGARASVGSFEETAAFGEAVVLACAGTAAEEVVRRVAGALEGKTVIDATNPIAPAPPEDGVLRYFTGPNESLMERLQGIAPSARLVKVFSCVGNAFMVKPSFPDGKPTMFICGNEEAAKREVRGLLDAWGWDVADMGRVTAARAIEPLAMLWCIPGLRQNQWGHAFKQLRL
jgi:predicted dinucleotide-binding enzyme